MTWVVVIGGLILLVFLHELGHFSVALAVGIRPRSFYIGFPPALAKVKRNGIEYGIGMIPLGGLVRIPGMHRPAARDVQVLAGPAVQEAPQLGASFLAVRQALDVEDYALARSLYPGLEQAVRQASLTPQALRSANRALRDVDEGTSPDAYWRAPTWKRVSVIIAGPLANVLVAFLILFGVFMTSGVASNKPTNEVAAVEAGLPAAAAGLQPGDRVVAVDGRRAVTFAAISHRIRASRGAPVSVTVRRGGKLLTLGPRRTVHRDGRWILGFAPAAQLVRYPAGRAASTAASDLGNVVTETAGGIASLFHSHSGAHLTSIVGITQAGAAALKVGWSYYLELLALVSMSLGLFNLLPLLPLDGGHILFSLIEAVRRRALAREVYERVSLVGITLILLVYVIALQNDAHHF